MSIQKCTDPDRDIYSPCKENDDKSCVVDSNCDSASGRYCGMNGKCTDVRSVGKNGCPGYFCSKPDLLCPKGAKHSDKPGYKYPINWICDGNRWVPTKLNQLLKSYASDTPCHNVGESDKDFCLSMPCNWWPVDSYSGGGCHCDFDSYNSKCVYPNSPGKSMDHSVHDFDTQPQLKKDYPEVYNSLFTK